MESAWEEIQPKNIYRVAKQLPLVERGQESLVHLYQPIIGATALSLYFSLLGDIQWQYGLSESNLHADLLADCNIGLPQFLEERRKLEGIGLLSAFYKQDPQLGKVFLYQLHDPLAPKAFLKDSVLTFLLKERLSDRKFETLLKRFVPKKLDTTGYSEITKSFQEIYPFHEESFAANYSQVEAAIADFDMQDEKPVELSVELDWDLVDETLLRQGVKTRLTDQEREELFLYHTMYGLDELELSELLARTANITEDKIDLKDFKKTIRQLYRKNKQQAVAVPKTPELPEKDQQTYRINSLKLDGFSELDIQIIQEVEKYAPMTYFQAIKEQKGGYVTEPETWVVKDLINKSGLPNSVINFLIHYVLVVRNSPVLNASYVNTIANEWAQKGIHTPEAALKHAREVNQKTEKKKNQPKNYGNRQVRREKVPEWMNKKSIPETKLSPEKQAELDAKLRRFIKDGDH